MIGINVKKKRFTLLYLEENELYVQDLSGSCTFPDYSTGSKRVEKGKIHVCSRSLIFEPNNMSIPIQKFLFRFMKTEPRRSKEHNSFSSFNRKGAEIFNEKHNDASLQKLFDKGQTSKNDSIIFQVSRVIEISTSGPPSPYIIHDDGLKDITIVPAFENVAKFMDKINKLIEFSKSSGIRADQQEELTKLILEDSQLKFNMSYLESITERPLIKTQIVAKRILPLVSIHGVFYLTNRNLYFQTIHSVVTKPVKIIHLEDITNIFRRRYELRQIGLEVYTKKKSYFFTFESVQERENVYKVLIERLGKEFDSQKRLEHVMEQWQKKEISNYEYLLFLNEAADRTFSDLTQYPVFPWVITDYTSRTIDLSDPKIYRDLSKPIGALNPERLEQYRERYRAMGEPRYMYGTHYSAPGYVIGYLLRKHPQYMLKFQSGKFDKADRLFWSLKKDWNNVINNNAISKELIPEFYEYDDSFLVNYQKLDLGLRQNGKRVNDVKLPKWAKDSKDFLRINRQALESNYVSENLHHWIDLIFGYKQQGEEAVKADNVFHYLTYEGAVNLDSIADPVERNAIKLQINEFGQTPKQIFKIPHPPRHDFKVQIYNNNLRNSSTVKAQQPTKNILKDLEEGEDFEIVEGSKAKNIIEINKENLSDDQEEEVHEEGKRMRDEDEEEEVYGEILKAVDSKKTLTGEDSLWEAKGLSKLKMEQVPKVHKSQVSGLWELPDKRVLSIGHDGFIKITQFQSMSVSRSFKVCDLSLSSVAEIKKNELYALGSWDNNLYIFNLNYGTKVFSEPLHEDAISYITFDQNKSTLYTTSWDCTVRSWGYKGGQIDTNYSQIIAETNSQISKMKLSSDGNLLLYGDLEGYVHLHDLRKQQGINSFLAGNEKITAMHFLSNKQIVVSGETYIKLMDMSGNEIIHIPIDHKLGLITDMDKEGTNLIISTDRGNASIFSVLQEKRIGAFCHENGLKDGEITPDYEFTCLKVMSEGRIGVLGSQSGSLTFNYYPDMRNA